MKKKSSLLCIKKPGTETRYIYKGGGWEELQEKIPIHYEILISVRVPINFFHDLTQATHPSPKKKSSPLIRVVNCIVLNYQMA